MTHSPLIMLTHVSKKYRLYERHARRVLEVLHPFGKRYHTEFWAVSDVSLRIHAGQTIGIIGRNGSGKSTLLQMIAGVLQPSSGTIETHYKKISALLELGAGFNPALTGRENVYIHGALMGFSREEMEGKIASIEEFADIGQFIDQPVKFYSSGMFVRLAFAAAINVDPDVLIVDEAISVGDAKFQHKCYLKLREFQQKGVTIIFVSHDMGAVTRVCDHLVLMDKGVLLKEGSPDEVVNQYLELLLADGRTVPSNAHVATSKAVQEHPTSKRDVEAFLNQSETIQHLTATRASYNRGEVRAGDKRAEIIDYMIVNERGDDACIFTSGDTVRLFIKAHFHQSVTTPVYGISIKTLDGIVIYATNTRIKEIPVRAAHAGDTHIFSFSMCLPLRQGDYFIDVGLTEAIQQGTDEALLDVHYSLAHFSITRPEELFDGLVELKVNAEEVLNPRRPE